MRLHRDDPERLTPIQWYFVDRDRPTLTGPSPFRSRVWERDQADVGIGELLDDWQYSPGRWPIQYTGNHYCGTAGQWQKGVTASDPVPEASETPGVSSCCGPWVYRAQGQLLFAGSAYVRSSIPALGGFYLTGDALVGGGLIGSGGLLLNGSAEPNPGGLSFAGTAYPYWETCTLAKAFPWPLDTEIPFNFVNPTAPIQFWFAFNKPSGEYWKVKFKFNQGGRLQVTNFLSNCAFATNWFYVPSTPPAFNYEWNFPIGTTYQIVQIRTEVGYPFSTTSGTIKAYKP